jgi:glycosyltransferase involved in cell wall biosynthesis
MRMFSNRVNLQIFRPPPPPSLTNNLENKKIEELSSLYPGKHRLLFIGRRKKQKNWDTVMRALHLLGSEYVCIFIGRGDKFSLINYANECNVTSQIYLVDTVQSNDLPYFMWLSDVFCVPSRWEGFGIVFIEAMASGSVVITSNLEPMNEYIVHEKNGLLINNVENEKELSEMVLRGVHDKELRRIIKRNGPLEAKRFSKEEIDRWEVSLYRMLIARPP